MKCKREFYVSPSSFLNGTTRCAKCSGKLQKNTEDFIREVYSARGDEYSVLGEYINAYTKIKIRHNPCGNEWDIKPNNFVKKNRPTNCPNCFGHKKWNAEQFKKEVEILTDGEYKCLTDYNHMHEKVKIIHCECNSIYEVKPSCFVHLGHRCPICRESKGEKLINNFLKKKNIDYKRQFKIEDCSNIRALPFDFAVFNKKNNLKCLIEYDGSQHFHVGKFNGTQEDFDQIQHRDSIKSQYCIDNNIPLIRIPYYDFNNISTILTTELINLGILSPQASQVGDQ